MRNDRLVAAGHASPQASPGHICPPAAKRPLLQAAPEIEIKRLTSLQLHVQLRWLLAAAPVSRKGFRKQGPDACL